MIYLLFIASIFIIYFCWKATEQLSDILLRMSEMQGTLQEIKDLRAKDRANDAASA